MFASIADSNCPCSFLALCSPFVVAIIRSSLGGKKLSEITADVVRGKVGHDIRPRYLFEKKKAKSGKMDVKPLNRAHVTPSYHAFEYRVRRFLGLFIC